ncbi:hypothetical protein PI124_g6531 [Phytophthora idaei]|nr:hypothetical protein PI125_g7697 [Phytophthora idaei]KAG3166877.1 hypothetical protein PI126_g4035 [Phytophthora idaei]KAG3248775.1 hypothetical protein PI124_g6531 [Phytophthora idaei]
MPPSTDIPIVITTTAAPVAIPDTPSTNREPSTAVPGTPEPTLRAVGGDTASPGTTTSTEPAPSGDAGSALTPAENPTTTSPTTEPPSLTPQPTFQDSTSGVTLDSSRQEASDATSSGQQEAKSSTAGSYSETAGSAFNDSIDTRTSSSGSFGDASVGDNSGGSIEFGSSSEEIPNEVRSDSGSQASSSKTNSGVRANPVISALMIEVALVVFY